MCFPVNFYEISKNTFFTEHLWTNASRRPITPTVAASVVEDRIGTHQDSR